MKDWNSITVDRYYEQLPNNNDVAIGILDISRDIENAFVQKRTFDMTYFYVNRMLKMGLCSYVGFHDKVEKILELAISANKKYCMIACQGLMLVRGPSLITQCVDYSKNNKDFFVVGHIMDKKKQHYLTTGSYPGLHRQFLFVNLSTWKKLEKPKFDEIGVYTDRKPKLKNYTLSEDTIHSVYTPSWITGADGEISCSVTADGSNWIDIACRNNIRIDNLDNDMRACKVFLYPYSQPNDIEKVWLDKRNDTVDTLTNQSQRSWIRKFGYQEQIERDRVYAFNTETLSGEGVRTSSPIDHLFTAAAGFKPLSLLDANGFHDKTEIHYFDWCDASLDYKKHLLNSWDGYDFHKWLLEHDLQYNFSSTYRGNYQKFWEQELKDQGGRDKFKNLWDRYKELKHHFHKIDIVNEPTKLFDIISKSTGTNVLWTTNIWSSEMLHWNVQPEELELKWKMFEEQIPKDLILYGHDYLAVDMQERVRKNFKTTHPKYYSKWSMT